MLANGKEVNLGTSGRSAGGGTPFAFKGWLVAAAVFWMVVAVVALGLSSAAADITPILNVNFVDFATPTTVFYNLALFGVAFTFYLPELTRRGITVEKAILLLCMAMALIASIVSSVVADDTTGSANIIQQAVAGTALTGLTQLLLVIPVFMIFRRLRPETALVAGGFCVAIGIVGASFYFVGASFFNGTLTVASLSGAESLANVLKASGVWLALASLVTIGLGFFMPRLRTERSAGDGSGESVAFAQTPTAPLKAPDLSTVASERPEPTAGEAADRPAAVIGVVSRKAAESASKPLNSRKTAAPTAPASGVKKGTASKTKSQAARKVK